MAAAKISLFLTELKRLGNPADIPAMRDYHKINRPYLGVRVPQIKKLTDLWIDKLDEKEILPLCDDLWASNIHEAHMAVGKFLEYNKLANLPEIWKRLNKYKENFDSWAMADSLAHVGFKVLRDLPEYLDIMERKWLTHKNFWVRRACLVFTLYQTKPGMDPERSLTWASGMVDDREWFIQKSIGWYLRELSKHNPSRVKKFLFQYAKRMKPFAVREASKYLA